MYLIKTPYLIKKLTGKSVIWDFPKGDNRLFLTFDDGPIPELTPQILKILDEFDVKASFFCVGENVFKYPDLFNEIIKRGHTIGNHTFNHLNGWKTNNDEYLTNINKANVLIHSELFRPPYGKVRISQLNEIKKQYFTILWSVLSGDFDINLSKEECLQNVKENTTDGAIIVFHDNIKSSERVLYTLPRFIEHFINKGFKFETISEKIISEYRKSTE